MSETDLSSIHKALIGFDKRAERTSDEILEATFVDSAPLFDLLSSKNNQVIYGRRGTGKTHALKYLARYVEKASERPIYIDLRSVGSNGSIYSDGSRPLAERASTLVLDVLNAIFGELYVLAVEALDKALDPDQVTLRLDDYSKAIQSVRITGTIETESQQGTSWSEENNFGLNLDQRATPSLTVALGSKTGNGANSSARTRRTGNEKIHLNFGNIGSSLSGLISVVGVSRIWLLIDEWSEVPFDLQPYLANLFRRTVLPIGSITLKVASIEHRSVFSISKDKGEYIGLELGADIAADLNLDDFLVFDNNQSKSTEFFKNPLFKHYSNSDKAIPELNSADRLIQVAFTQVPVFEEFVRAVEGVPRDALNLAAKVATKAYGQTIAAQHVRSAARDWYQQDKQAVIRSNKGLHDLLIDDIIGKRRARAFLFPSNFRNTLIDKLFDARLLHILKKNVSTHDEPGVRYDVYKIDYGCYVDLINTAKMPKGLFEAEEDGADPAFVEVPKDDYRSIRRAILHPDKLQVALTV
ncbi:MAG: hypothetical protein WA624_22290 [Methylocella sp.]